MDDKRIFDVGTFLQRNELRCDSVENLRIKFSFKKFQPKDLGHALNLLRQYYGTRVQIHYLEDQYLITRRCMLYVDDALVLMDDREILRINYIDIRDLDTDLMLVPTPPLGKHNRTCFLHLTTGDDFIMIEFENVFKRDWGHQALQYLIIKGLYQLQFKNHYLFIQDQAAEYARARTKDFKPRDVSIMSQKLGLSWSKDQIQQLFFSKNDVIPRKQIATVLCEKLIKKDLLEPFKMYCSNWDSKIDPMLNLMTLEDFQSFMTNEQQLTDNKLIKQTYKSLKSDEGLSYLGFSEYMFSFENEIYDHVSMLQDDPMNVPIHKYYINSSQKALQYTHIPNTIWQIKHLEHLKHGLHALAFNLLRGVRNLEFEIWEGQDETRPVAYFGEMLDHHIDVVEILKMIADLAFENTNLPLFLHVDEHCGKVTKAYIESQFVKHLGPYLLQFDYMADPTPNHYEKKILLTGTVRIIVQELIHSDRNRANTIIPSKLGNHGKTLSQSQYMARQTNPDQSNQSSQSNQINNFIPGEFDMDEMVETKQSNVDYHATKSNEMQRHRIKNFSIHQIQQEMTKSATNSPLPVRRCVKIAQTQIINATNSPELYKGNMVLRNFLIIGIQQRFRYFQVPTNTTLRDKSLLFESSDCEYLQILSKKTNTRKQKPDMQEFQNSFISQSDDTIHLERLVLGDSKMAEDYLVKWYNSKSHAQYGNPQSPQQGLFYWDSNDYDETQPHRLQLSLLLCDVQRYRGFHEKFHTQIRDIDSIKKRLSIYRIYGSLSYTGESSIATLSAIQIIEHQAIGRKVFGASHEPKSEGVRPSNVSFKNEILYRHPVLLDQEKIQHDVSLVASEIETSYNFNKDFSFEIGSQMRLSVLIFIVYDAITRKLISWNAVRMDQVRCGYRTVQLLDERLNRINNSILLVKIKMK